MSKPNSTPRVQSLEQRRKAEGWHRLRDWLPPDTAKEFLRQHKASGLDRADFIASLLQRAE